MTPSRSNYDKARDATAAVFLRYDQAAMIRKFGLSHDADALYITFIARDYRVDRRTGAVTWASDTAHTASYNEAMSIYDVLCDSQPLCHLSHEWVNVASLCSIQGGTLSKDGDFFKNSCARFSGDAAALDRACRALGGIPQPIGGQKYAEFSALRNADARPLPPDDPPAGGKSGPVAVKICFIPPMAVAGKAAAIVRSANFAPFVQIAT